MHLQRIHAGRTVPVSVVVFSRPGSLLQDAVSPRLARVFEREGHNLTVVKSDRDFRAALEAKVGDVVMIDVADASVIADSPVQPAAVIAVVAKSDRQGIAAAKRFAAVMKFPAKPDDFLDAIDRALDAPMSKKVKHDVRPILSQ